MWKINSQRQKSVNSVVNHFHIYTFWRSKLFIIATWWNCLKFLCASITHWLGSISKLPNQCENITKFSRQFQNCPINVRKLPNQCEMLAHPPCASISHWLGSFQKILGSFQVYQIYQNYPINVKCLHRGGAQAFHID